MSVQIGYKRTRDMETRSQSHYRLNKSHHETFRAMTVTVIRFGALKMILLE